MDGDNDIDLTWPLVSLSSEFSQLLSKLNPRRVLTAEGPGNLLRDWRGLANLLEIPNETANSISECHDKAGRVIEIWIQRNDGTATLGTLIDYLQRMDRYDIYDDIIDLAQRGRIHGSRPDTLGYRNELMPQNGYKRDSMILTNDDRRDGRPNYYHAYVLFAQEDWSFVRELLEKMRESNLKLCTEYDIDIGYGTQYAPVSQLISDRCYRIILVYSPAFLQSPANTFFSDYAQAVGIETNKRNIIPIVYRPCQLPHHLMYYHKLVYKPSGEWMPYDFWEKLRQTLEKVRLPTVNQTNSSLSINELSDVSASYLTTSSSQQDYSMMKAGMSFDGPKTEEVNLSDMKFDSTSSISNYKDEKKNKKGKVIKKVKSFFFG